MYDASPYLNVSDKWKQTYEQWPWQKLPPYAMGSGYLIAGSAIEPLLAAAQVIPFPFPNGAFEDEFITAFCSAIANVTFRTSPERYYTRHDFFLLKFFVLLTQPIYFFAAGKGFMLK